MYLAKQPRLHELVCALIKYPLTVDMLLRASRAFQTPYTNATQLKGDLLHLHREGYLNRQPIPTLGPGQQPFLYFLKPKARLLVPEVAALPRSHAVFRGFAEAPWHTLAAADFMSHVERSAGESGGRVRIHAVLRPRQFRARVELDRGSERRYQGVVPDYTFVATLDGVFSLFFVELQNHTAVINPVDPHSLTRSFRFKLAKYKAFQQGFQAHELVQHLQRVYNCRFPGFRVLVATTQGEANKRSLLDAARDYKRLFYFSTLAELGAGNLFADALWDLPSGARRGLLD